MTLRAVLLLVSALFSVGLYGALSQRSPVMIMMGLELMVNGVIAGAGACWWYLSPDLPDGQVLVLLAFSVMAIEMAIGFAVVTAIYRSREADTVEAAADLSG